MKKTEITDKGNYNIVKFNGSYSTMYHWKNPGNCKLCTFDNLGAHLIRDEKEVVEYIKKYAQLTFFVNFNKRKYVDILKKHFKLIYCVKVPIGYGSNYQWHCLFSRMDSYPKTYRKRLEYHANRKKLENIIEVK